MKKFLVVLLTLALCVTTLASCDFVNQFLDNFQQLRDDAFDVQAAAEYIYNLYKDKSITAADFEVS